MKPRAVIVHGLADAEAALTAAAALGRRVVLLSAADAAAHGGAGWFQALVTEAARRHPGAHFTAILDCGARADLVQSAFAEGLREVVFRGWPRLAGPLLDIARQRGAKLHRRAPVALDLLGEDDPTAACRAWLGRD
jgi:hypothetical protein